jgi:hypothetical protein
MLDDKSPFMYQSSIFREIAYDTSYECVVDYLYSKGYISRDLAIKWSASTANVSLLSKIHDLDWGIVAEEAYTT